MDVGVQEFITCTVPLAANPPSTKLWRNWHGYLLCYAFSSIILGFFFRVTEKF